MLATRQCWVPIICNFRQIYVGMMLKTVAGAFGDKPICFFFAARRWWHQSLLRRRAYGSGRHPEARLDASGTGNGSSSRGPKDSSGSFTRAKLGFRQ